MANKDYYVTGGELSFELDEEHTDTELTNAEMNIITQEITKTGTAVHLCCGAGRHLLAFADLNIPSIGIDFSPFLVRQAAKATTKSNITLSIVGDIVTLPIKPVSCCTVTLLGNSFTMIPETSGPSLFREISQALCSKGRFIVDVPEILDGGERFIQKPVILRQIDTQALGLGDLQWERTLDQKTRTLTSIETFSYDGPSGYSQNIKQTISFKLYKPEELSEMATDAGLSLVKTQTLNDPTGRYRGMMKRRVFMTFEKN